MRTTKRTARYHTLSGKKTQQGVTREERVQSFLGGNCMTTNWRLHPSVLVDTAG